MHQAPALALTLPPDRLWLGSVRILGVSALLVALVWLGWHAVRTGTPTPVMLLLAALCSLPALWLLCRDTPTAAVGCNLSWHPEKAQWCLQTLDSNGQASPLRSGRLDCVADGMRWMLLRHTGRGLPSVWLCVSHRDHPAHWHTLRCAVFSPGARPEPAAASDE